MLPAEVVESLVGNCGSPQVLPAPLVESPVGICPALGWGGRACRVTPLPPDPLWRVGRSLVSPHGPRERGITTRSFLLCCSGQGFARSRRLRGLDGLVQKERKEKGSTETIKRGWALEPRK